MAISKVVVVDGNNLIVRIDRGVAGRGVTDVEPVEISGSLYLVFTFSDGTTETVGPVGTVAYVGQSPIVINASTISLSTVPVNLGGTGQITANAGFNALAPAQTGNSGKYLKTDGTNSAWDLLDISTADITGTLPIVNGGTGQTTANASFNALAPSQATNTGKYLKTDGTNTSWDLLDISTADITGTLAITNGGTGATTASGARTNLGLGTIATQDASAVAITGGSITGITDLAVADGGTGASTAAGARTNLNAADQATTLTAGTGLSGGGDLSANRTFSITNTGVSAASYGSASNTLTATVNAQGQLTALAATPIAIANTQISGLGTISTQNANAVAITGGSITGITDLAVADGGTGASDAAGARTNLNAANQATTITAGTGLSGGGDLSANRTIDIANTTVTAGSFGSASNTLTATVNAQGQLTALAATPIAIANTQVSGLGTLSTQNSNAVTITGGSITGITDLAIADGGTGASNAADARSNLGLGSAAVLNAGVALGVATLDAGGTVPLSQIPASIQGGVSYQGAWNASTNTPTLVSSVGSKGYYYVVSVSGNTNLNGVTDWLVGDWAIFNGTAWQKIDNTDQVASVNGYTGVVVLSNTDVGAPPTSLTISAGTGLSGGGNLTTNRTLSIANTTVTAAPYGTASAVPTFTVNGQGQLTAAADVTIAIANTQVSGLGTISTQNANSVAITGGSITGITDLAVADGGTGASNATDARSNLSAAYNAITISAGTGLTGGGDLTANRTLAIDSSVVTLTGTQTLTNKTLTSPLVNEILDTNGNEILGLSPTASATDFVTVKNGIGTGVPLHIYADGPSTNIGLHLQPKGSGLITISDGTDFNKGIRFRSSGSAASAVTLLDAVSTAGRVVTLPDATTTLVGRDTTDTLTNKTIAFGSNTFSGSLAIANGGTGQATANAAFNALAPSQTGNSGKYLTTDGTDTSWASNPLGTVTSVAASVPSFLSIAGSPITTSGTLAISLSGTALPTTSGGTGLTSFTANGVAYASSSSALTTGSALTFNGSLLTTGGSTSGSTIEVLRLVNAGAGANTQAQIKFFTTSTNYGTISGGYGASSPQMTFDLPVAGGYVWQSVGVEKLSLSGTGNLTNTRSITTAYSATNGATWTNGLFLYNNTTPAAGVSNFVQFGGSANVNNAFGVVQNASGYGDFVWAGYNGSFTEFGRFTSAGNFGIGTNAPSYLLDVNGTFRSSITGGSIYTQSAGGIPRLYIGGGNGFGFNRQSAGEDIFFGEPSDTGTYRVRGAGTISLGVGSTGTTMTMTGNNGWVGIGTTTNNGQTLKVGDAGTALNSIIGMSSSSAGYCALWFGDADSNVGYIQYDHTNNAMSFRTNGAEAGRYTSAGNLVIGDTTATAKLDVFAGQSTQLRVRATSTRTSSSVLSAFQDDTNGGRGTWGNNAYTNTQYSTALTRYQSDISGWAIIGNNFTSTYAANDSLQFSYVNTSGTTLEYARFNNLGNYGLGTTPNRWFSNRKALQIGGSVGAITMPNGYEIGLNFYVEETTAAEKRIQSGYANKVVSDASVGDIVWSTAGTGAAGSSIAWGEKMRLTNGGAFVVGDTTAASNAVSTAKLTVASPSGNSGVIATGMGTTGTLTQNATGNTYSFGGYAGIGLITVIGADPSTAWRGAALVWSNGASLVIYAILQNNVTFSSSGTTVTITNTSASSEQIAWSMMRLS